MSAQSIEFADTLTAVISSSHVYPTEPHFLAPNLSADAQRRILDAIAEIGTAEKQVRKMSGQDFEKFVRHIFSLVGASVQSNIRLLGTEIDLVLLEIGDHGKPNFTILEIKNHAKSGKRVEVSVVLKLFGLESALRRLLPIKGSFIVSTTGFTSASLHLAKLYQLEARGLDQLASWLRAHYLQWHVKKAPLFDITSLSKSSQVCIRQTFRRYGGSGRKAVLLGGRGCFELWLPDAYEAYQQAETTTWRDIASAVGL